MTFALGFWGNTPIHDDTVWIELSIQLYFLCMGHARLSQCKPSSVSYTTLRCTAWNIGGKLFLSPCLQIFDRAWVSTSAESLQTNHWSHSDDSCVYLQSSWDISFSRSFSAILLLVLRSMSHRPVVRANGRCGNVGVTCDPIQLSRVAPERKCNQPNKTPQVSNYWSKIVRCGGTQYRVHKKWLTRDSHSDPVSSP
jgi:hypothetical protein